MTSVDKLKGLVAPIALLLLMSGCVPVKFSAEAQKAIVPDGGDPGTTSNPTPTPVTGGGTPTPTPTSGGTPTPTPTSTPRTVTYSSVVPVASNNVDILLVIDNSGSMERDQNKLAARLSNFASMLENQAALPIDWQMCVTTTNAQAVTGKTALYWGASVNWVGYTAPTGTPQYILKKGTTNLDSIFSSTINAIGSGVPNSDDERAIKAAYNHFYNGDPNVSDGSGCYRKGSSVAVVIISNEDERSVGGDCSKIKNYSPFYESPASCLPLESEDLPANLLTQAKTIFGQNVRFTFNSIVVADSTCESAEDAIKDNDGNYSPSHQGLNYIKMSNLTNGGVGSICDSDYSANLNLFKDKISNSLSSLTLECAPVAGSLTVKVNGTVTTDYTLTGASLTFNHAVVEGQQVDMTYKCN